MELNSKEGYALATGSQRSINLINMSIQNFSYLSPIFINVYCPSSLQKDAYNSLVNLTKLVNISEFAECYDTTQYNS
jgi:hypothetical protein